ncbi:hypothetical protein AO501_08360 [Mycobacterium gordonae]|uniref:Uncharacterized protein n=1 Tax=Mycobacterium gordonae TaxID=1778 RepID=A0A0Q2UGG1_MYCGO|nr:hypothetical protein [Mycobacterium gordonae]KQH79848.1 hypothetical protein AO501_08360 [Mycobacterium gordonae]
MPVLHTTVYLNESPDRLWGLSTPVPTGLRQAASFDLEIGDDLTGQALIHAAHRIVFEQLNIDNPTATWALRYRLAGHRSFSVGDVMVIGETAWLCEPVGWTCLTTADLIAALATR